MVLLPCIVLHQPFNSACPTWHSLKILNKCLLESKIAAYMQAYHNWCCTAWYWKHSPQSQNLWDRIKLEWTIHGKTYNLLLLCTTALQAVPCCSDAGHTLHPSTTPMPPVFTHVTPSPFSCCAIFIATTTSSTSVGINSLSENRYRCALLTLVVSSRNTWVAEGMYNLASSKH